ncbi:MAG TPA: acyl-CoA dehydrogenase family protein [Acidimicrobiia bacterium]|nr:acyl-CoA dehydrogenase family protein [Acidimicrobiia bacterium]
MAESDLARVDKAIDDLLAAHDPAPTDPKVFRGAQYDLGLAWVHFPEGFGGMGLAPIIQRHVDRRLREAGARPPAGMLFFGLSLAGPTVVTHGNDDLRRRALRPMFTGEEIWCQLFSEPGAGSDLAGLATRAVRDGDEWIVNGQKVWNTLAHVADRGMLVARTDPDIPKHKGLTYFMVDMHAPGVEVRPLRQITGEAEFNEVYLTDAHIADRDRIGDIGDGWRVSMTTLMNERTTIGAAGSSGTSARRATAIQEAVDLWRKRAAAERDAVSRDRLARLWIENRVLHFTNQRAAAKARAGTPGPEGSIAKLALANVNKSTYEFCIDLLGADGTVGYDYTFKRPDEGGLDAPLGSARKMFLRARANSIEGGTSEIMRNILGERILGLPGEPRADRDLPWSQVPRS